MLDVDAESHTDEGLGDVDVWSGLLDGMPFAIRSMANPRGGFGFEILFPVRIDGDRVLLEALQILCTRLHSWRSPYFGSLPLDAGFAVVGDTDDAPIYASPTRERATAVVDFLHEADAATPYRVVPLQSGPPQWLVVGPETGAYICRVDVHASEELARQQAVRWSAETGATFDVRTHL